MFFVTVWLFSLFQTYYETKTSIYLEKPTGTGRSANYLFTFYLSNSLWWNACDQHGDLLQVDDPSDRMFQVAYIIKVSIYIVDSSSLNFHLV